MAISEQAGHASFFFIGKAAQATRSLQILVQAGDLCCDGSHATEPLEQRTNGRTQAGGAAQRRRRPGTERVRHHQSLACTGNTVRKRLLETRSWYQLLNLSSLFLSFTRLTLSCYVLTHIVLTLSPMLSDQTGVGLSVFMSPERACLRLRSSF